jgi:putative selenate reductase
MDVARAAKRVPGVEHVRLVYRRTRRYMPADEEELVMALEDGVEFVELLAPDTLDDGKLSCDVMRLGEPDASGRRSPVPTGDTVFVDATTVITAVGERIQQGLYQRSGVELDRKGRPVVNDQLETSVPHVYAVGDARRGPSTVVKAIADAATVTTAISNFDFSSMEASNISSDVAKILGQRGSLCADCSSMATTRCLGCPTICETCCEVCPNRANVAIHVPGMRQSQIVHIDGMCNECGNCAVFCPYEGGRPYKDKLTLFWSREDFDDSQNEGFLPVDGGFLVRLGQDAKVYDVDDASCGLPEGVRKAIVTVRNDYSYLLC